MAVDQAEVNGRLYGLYKGGTSLNTANKAATWIVQNVYDVERTKGENRAQLIGAIEQALKHYAGSI